MGFDVWISRAQAVSLNAAALAAAAAEQVLEEEHNLETGQGVARYLIGPGSGQTLLLCQRRADAASRLASDIARCLDETPVWGWQAQPVNDPGFETDALDLESAIRDRLFTRVLVFGGSAAEAGNPADVLGSARIIHAPALAELARSPEHKRNLWSKLVACGWCKRFA